eukprot:gene19867-26561_t
MPLRALLLPLAGRGQAKGPAMQPPVAVIGSWSCKWAGQEDEDLPELTGEVLMTMVDTHHGSNSGDASDDVHSEAYASGRGGQQEDDSRPVTWLYEASWTQDPDLSLCTGHVWVQVLADESLVSGERQSKSELRPIARNVIKATGSGGLAGSEMAETIPFDLIRSEFKSKFESKFKIAWVQVLADESLVSGERQSMSELRPIARNVIKSTGSFGLAGSGMAETIPLDLILSERIILEMDWPLFGDTTFYLQWLLLFVGFLLIPRFLPFVVWWPYSVLQSFCNMPFSFLTPQFSTNMPASSPYTALGVGALPVSLPTPGHASYASIGMGLVTGGLGSNPSKGGLASKASLDGNVGRSSSTCSSSHVDVPSVSEHHPTVYIYQVDPKSGSGGYTMIDAQDVLIVANVHMATFVLTFTMLVTSVDVSIITNVHMATFVLPVTMWVASVVCSWTDMAAGKPEGVLLLTWRQLMVILAILPIHYRLLGKMASMYGLSAILVSPAAGWAVPLAIWWLRHARSRVMKSRTD